MDYTQFYTQSCGLFGHWTLKNVINESFLTWQNQINDTT